MSLYELLVREALEVPKTIKVIATNVGCILEADNKILLLKTWHVNTGRRDPAGTKL